MLGDGGQDPAAGGEGRERAAPEEGEQLFHPFAVVAALPIPAVEGLASSSSEHGLDLLADFFRQVGRVLQENRDNQICQSAAPFRLF